MANGPSTYSKRLIMKIMLRFPWTTCEPAHNYGAMPFVLMCDPLCGNKCSRYPQKIVGNQGCWSRGSTRLTAADGSVKRKWRREGKNTLLPLACDSDFNKRLTCRDTSGFSWVDPWQHCCGDPVCCCWRCGANREFSSVRFIELIWVYVYEYCWRFDFLPFSHIYCLPFTQQRRGRWCSDINFNNWRWGKKGDSYSDKLIFVNNNKKKK